jgi:hypothetical protein
MAPQQVHGEPSPGVWTTRRFGKPGLLGGVRIWPNTYIDVTRGNLAILLDKGGSIYPSPNSCTSRLLFSAGCSHSDEPDQDTNAHFSSLPYTRNTGAARSKSCQHIWFPWLNASQRKQWQTQVTYFDQHSMEG